MELAPIALFAYNRPHHLARTISALQNNELAGQSDLYVFSDGPRSLHDAEKIKEVRNLLQGIDGFRKVTIIKQSENLGLSRSVIYGVTELCQQYGKVIVLEDDLLVSNCFLQFMNNALQFYENEHTVFSIAGYMYHLEGDIPTIFFRRGTNCWGWGTWQRAWSAFERNGEKLYNELKSKNLRQQFDLDGAYPYSKMLLDQVKGRNDSWAIRWYASVFLLNGLTLMPGKSLVINIGLDGSGTHCGKEDDMNIHEDFGSYLHTEFDNIEIVEDAKVIREISLFLKKRKKSIRYFAKEKISYLLEFLLINDTAPSK